MPTPAQGEIWWADLPAPAGRRPVLVLTRTAALPHLSNATITRTRRGLRAEVDLTRADGVPTDCTVSLENILTIPQGALRRRIATLGAAKLTDVFHAIHFVFAMPF